MNTLPTVTAAIDAEQEPVEETFIEMGQWYWLDMSHDWEDEEKITLGCVTHVGSNYVRIESPHGRGMRIHLDELDELCRLEKDPMKAIREKKEETQTELRTLMGKVHDITKRLGVSQSPELPDPTTTAYALAPLHGRANLKQHKRALTKAKEKELPELFEEMKVCNKELAIWLKAETLPFQATVKQMEGCIGELDDRIFHVDLYAGLSEQTHRVLKGKKAAIDEKLHVMQRRCYMDEECLAEYQAGGMNIEGIEQFDNWLKKPKNFKRLLPFPKCIVSFRVRHMSKDYREELNPFVRISLREADKLTFLYIRNGDNLYCMESSLDFGSNLFPDIAEFNTDEKLWARIDHDKVDHVLTDRDYRERCTDEKKRKRNAKKWEKENPKKSDFHNPYRDSFSDHREDKYTPFNPSSVYYDDIKESIDDSAKYYNRIALIIQGLFDRSKILHPHLPVQIWNTKSFQDSVKLVYDSDHALYEGEKPDFEAYRAKLNESICDGCAVVGQEKFWEVQMAEKENARQNNDWRIKRPFQYVRFKPYGNPGPGLIAKVVKLKSKSQECRFKWRRERKRRRHSWDIWSDKGQVDCSFSVPVCKLLNVDAYTRGDFKQFFKDPRTRQEYLKWAPLLLAAEDYHAQIASVSVSRVKERRKRARKGTAGKEKGGK